MSLAPRLAYEATLGALEQQERVASDLVQRTAALLAASSLTASFLGAESITRAVTAAAGSGWSARAASLMDNGARRYAGMTVLIIKGKSKWVEGPNGPELVLGSDDVFRDLTLREAIRALLEERREAKRIKREARRSTA